MTANDPRKVTLVTRIHLPEPSAASLRLDSVEKELLRQGVSTAVLTSLSEHEAVSDPAGLEVSRWKTLRDSNGQLRGYLPYISFDLPLMFRILKSRKPNVYLVEPPPTTGSVMRMMSTLVRVPYVWYAADVWSDATRMAGAPKFVEKVVTWMESFAIKGAAHVIAVSDGVAERVRELGGNQVTIVPNGIDTDRFTPNVSPISLAERRELGVELPYLIYAGTASEWQGAEIFVDALNGLDEQSPEFQVVFIGQGSSWESIKQRAEKLPRLKSGAKRVVVLDQVDFDEAARWQVGAEAALVSIRPGLGYDFAYPTKVLSALSSGVPVIFAGRGPVAVDLQDSLLGRAVDYETSSVLNGMLAALESQSSEEERTGRHDWVVQNRSTKAVGRAVTAVLMDACKRNSGN